MEDTKLPDLNQVRESGDSRVLPPQTSPEDTSNWDNRAITLPNPDRAYAEFVFGDTDLDSIEKANNPYAEQEQLRSADPKK